MDRPRAYVGVANTRLRLKTWGCSNCPTRSSDSASFYCSAGRPGALHVRLDGALEQRIARAGQESGIDLERAAQRQKRDDPIRADMSIEFYGWDPRELDRYDLVVNTGTMDLDTGADIIVQAVRVKVGRQRAS